MFRRSIFAIGFVLMVIIGLFTSSGQWSTPTASGATVPPAQAVNDNYADATEITLLPTNQQVDIRLATLESGEPAPSCGYGSLDNTVWYRFTPADDQTITVSAQSNDYWSGVLGVYVGGSLTTLSQIDCREFDRWSSDYGVSFKATTATTYYIQLGGLSGGKGVVSFSFSEAESPSVNGLNISPYQSSIYNQVEFSGYGSDPVGIYGFSYRWLIDGQEYFEQHPTVNFEKDGEYSALLEMTTADGRSDQMEKTFTVETHDVILNRFRGPSVGQLGLTASIRVGIHNENYPDEVTVKLYRSVPGGFREVGHLTQFVDVSEMNKATTDFHFSYTFTEQDEAIGRVTFKAEAFLTENPEALPADNAYTTWPVYVNAPATPIDGAFDFQYREFVRDENEVLIPSILK